MTPLLLAVGYDSGSKSLPRGSEDHRVKGVVTALSPLMHVASTVAPGSDYAGLVRLFP